jgi:hypothetical protein
MGGLLHAQQDEKQNAEHRSQNGDQMHASPRW